MEEVVSEAFIRLKKRPPDAQITVQVPDNFLMIPMDAILIEQVLINLLENAVLHSGRQRPIACSVESQPDYVCFHVRDYGIGIAPDKRKTLFDGTPYTGNTSPDSSKGMGIGLSLVTSVCPDLILLNLGLPDMDGIDIIRQIRTWASIPIIVISARTQEQEKVLATDSGADDYITKPFGPPELMARIRTALRHGNRLNTGSLLALRPYQADGLVIDFEKHLITLDGTDIHLTQVEYKIVSLLAQNSGRVITYDSIISNVWGPYANDNNRILRVNMANIRRKLEKNPAEPHYIFTEIGIGYRMLEDTPERS